MTVMRRLKVYDWVITVFFIVNIVAQPINDQIIRLDELDQHLAYSLFFSIGLYLGFKLYQWEVRKYWKKGRI